jgi:hypothetical protein
LDVELKQFALKSDHRFELALSLDALDIELSIAEQSLASEKEIR